MRLAVHGGFLQVTRARARPRCWPRRRAAAGLSTRVTLLAGVAELAERDRRAPGRAGPRRRPRPAADATSAPAGVRSGEDAERGRRAAPRRRDALARAELRLDRGRRERLRGRRSRTLRRRATSAELDAELYSASLARAWLASILPYGARLRPHDQRLGGGPELVVADALEQLAVGDAGGGEEAVVPLDQVVGGEDGVEVVAGRRWRPAARRRRAARAGPGSRRPCT